ncbi:MAG: hypothetical protein D3924_09405 [Candidatus Electrothrix sp. AR4]|nr:hypothetical protein [Candidatus Electrothrix sp. AR4]
MQQLINSNQTTLEETFSFPPFLQRQVDKILEDDAGAILVIALDGKICFIGRIQDSPPLKAACQG